MVDSIRRTEAGVVLVLQPAEVELLRDLAGQLESLLAGGVPERGGDKTRDRLFPRAYLDPTEDAAETEWQAAVHGDLVREKSAAVEALVDSLDTGTSGRKDTLTVTLGPEAVEQWVAAVNDVRLALGVVLEVSEDEPRLDRGDPRRPGFEVYQWLTWLQGSLVQQLLADIDIPDDGP